MPKKTVNCPTCNKTVTWEPLAKFRPFCSDRCRLIDLGEWFNEENVIPEASQDPMDPTPEIWSTEDLTKN